jgi:hypothetical protein
MRSNEPVPLMESLEEALQRLGIRTFTLSITSTARLYRIRLMWHDSRATLNYHLERLVSRSSTRQSVVDTIASSVDDMLKYIEGLS